MHSPSAENLTSGDPIFGAHLAQAKNGLCK